MRIAAPILLVCALLFVPACGSSSSTTATTPAVITPGVEVFTGQLVSQGSIFYSFSTSNPGTIAVTLVTLNLVSPGPVSSTVVGMGFGIPMGVGCAVTSSVKTGVGLVPQLSLPASPGTYCVQISDLGTITDPLNFAIRISHP